MDSDGWLARRYEHSSSEDAILLARRGRGPNEFTVDLEAGPSAVAAARAAVDTIADRLDDETLGEVRLLVSELVTNSIRHSGAHSRAVTLEMSLPGDKLRCEVSDRGSGFDPRPRTRDQSQASGWGLYLVDRVADRWGVDRRDGVCVWFEMDRRAAA